MEMDMMTMCMYFYNSAKVHLVFKGWDPQSNGSYFGYLVLVFLVAFMAETLCVVNAQLESSSTVMLKATKQPQTVQRLAQAIITFCQVLASYFTMLAVMTFNGGVFIAAVLGLTMSYAVMGFKPTRVRLTHNYFLNSKGEDSEGCCQIGTREPTSQSGYQ